MGQKKSKLGDCFFIAGRFALDDAYPLGVGHYKGTLKLVQAVVSGQGRLKGLRYAHAFIMDNENVYDFSNGRQLVLPKEFYFDIGNIRPENPKEYREYTFPQPCKQMVETGHFGSWELESEL